LNYLIIELMSCIACVEVQH